MVTGLGWQSIRAGRKKSVTVLDVTYSGALDAADATNLDAYSLKAALGKKRHSHGFLLPYLFESASFAPATNTVQLRPILKIPKNTLMQLTINGSRIHDTTGRQLDGNGDGQAGGNFVGTLTSGGGSSMARAMVDSRSGRETGAAIDALMTDESLAGLSRRRHRHGHRNGNR